KVNADGTAEKLPYSQSNVLYFALNGGGFVCIRPSGTEPKIKLYVNVNHKDKATADTLLAEVADGARALLKAD
ncbi:MAG TPA: phospho-sugar mutase, partial [Candidatus Limiplasma sp.]|nr:phospho-sugar mutase [Candidatus Limiplasma sp.]